MEKEFGKFGPLEKLNVVLDGKTGRSRGFAFVTFQKVEDATEARNALSDAGRQFHGDFTNLVVVVWLVILLFAVDTGCFRMSYLCCCHRVSKSGMHI